MASGGVSPTLGAQMPKPAAPVGLSPLNPASTTIITSTTSSETPITKICVFCGASPGKSPAHMKAARQLANIMADHNIHLVFGGGSVGLMGEVAKTVVSRLGPEAVHGIIPSPLVKYERGPSATNDPNSDVSGILPEYKIYGRTTVVKDMHTRKQMMAQEVLAGGPGSGFVALSGGYGTLEELMEVVTWNQLGIHGRGVVVLNVEGYWDGLLQWVKNSVEAGFVGEGNRNIIIEARDGEGAVQALKEYVPAGGRFKLTWENQ